MPVQVREIRPPLVGVPNGPQPSRNILYGLGLRYIPTYIRTFTMSDFLVVESISRARVLHYLPPEIGCIL